MLFFQRPMWCPVKPVYLTRLTQKQLRRSGMIIDLFKTKKITPKGCHFFAGKPCHLFRQAQHTAFGIEYCVTSVI